MLDKVKDILKNQTKLPKHLAITMQGIELWAKKNNIPLEEANKKSFFIVKNTIKSQVKLKIPILTFYLLPNFMKEDSEQYMHLINTTAEFFSSIASSDLIHKNKIKISVLGKWYDLPDRVVGPIKQVIESTKDYDSFFTNFCINYSGQEEIVDACRLIARQVKAEKIDPDSINKEMIKENLYSSYFIPPDLIIKNGKEKIPGLLLWDSINSKVYFTKKLWPDFDKAVFMDAIKDYQKRE